jgi:hypothetical protein
MARRNRTRKTLAYPPIPGARLEFPSGIAGEEGTRVWAQLDTPRKAGKWTARLDRHAITAVPLATVGARTLFRLSGARERIVHAVLSLPYVQEDGAEDSCRNIRRPGSHSAPTPRGGARADLMGENSPVRESSAAPAPSGRKRSIAELEAGYSGRAEQAARDRAAAQEREALRIEAERSYVIHPALTLTR